MQRLWQQADCRWQHALNDGVLQPRVADWQWQVEGGVPFILRCRRPTDTVSVGPERRAWQRADPFADPSRQLRVADVGIDHLCLLNRFPVLSRHLLLVTRGFVPQSQLPDRRDFAALIDCMRWQPCLAFYNSGPLAGASQPHKHLQLSADLSALPFAPLINAALAAGLDQVPELPFRHSLQPLARTGFRYPSDALSLVEKAFVQALADCGLRHDTGRAERPFNLLMTRRWLMVVPRSADRVEGVSINALGFAGNLLTGDPHEQQQLQQRGLLNSLAAVCAD